jgi:hypothetical protein
MGEDEGAIFLGLGATPQRLLLRAANRHGLITGATGTGKTVSLQIMAEGFSAAGVPVFMADIKGDLSGISQAGTPHPRIDERAREQAEVGWKLAFQAARRSWQKTESAMSGQPIAPSLHRRHAHPFANL